MPVKVVFGWGFNNVGPKRPGFSEVHYYLPAATSGFDQALITDAVALMNARTQLMGSNVIASMLRVSFPNRSARSRLLYAVPNGFQQNPINQTAIIGQGLSDIPNSCVAADLTTLLAQVARMYIAGLPDAVIHTGNPTGPDFAAPGTVNYQAYWNTWTGLLVSGTWGSKFLNTPPAGQPTPINYWQQGTTPPFNLQFVLPDTSPYTPNVGDTVHIRGVLMGVSGVPRPVGKWKIKLSGAVDPTHTYYELDQSSTYQAVLVQQPGTVESVTYSYQPYFTIGNLLQTTHRRGVGPVRPRGRSRPRARRQPV